jgi:hypothetical protein
MSLYLLTFTLRYDPSDEADLSVAGLQRRKDAVLDGFRHVWRKYLKPRARAAVRSFEVGSAGMVHAHVLYHGLRPDIVTLRMLYMLRVGDSPSINVRYVREPAKGIAELAKYVTKGASPVKTRSFGGAPGEYLDPLLAARVEVAFAGERLVDCYGAWRGIDPDDDDDAAELTEEPCSQCGATGRWSQVDIPPHVAACLGSDVRARVSRYGPDPPRALQRTDAAHENPSPGATA